MSRNGIRQQEVRSSDAPPTPRRRPRYRLPKTSDDDWPTTVAGDLLRERFEARAKKEQQDFVNAFKRVDMANKEIHGKASEEQMKVLEDALRDQGDKAKGWATPSREPPLQLALPGYAAIGLRDGPQSDRPGCRYDGCRYDGCRCGRNCPHDGRNCRHDGRSGRPVRLAQTLLYFEVHIRT